MHGCVVSVRFHGRLRCVFHEMAVLTVCDERGWKSLAMTEMEINARLDVGDFVNS